MGTKDVTHEAVAKALADNAPLTHEQRSVLLGLVADDKAWQRECDRLRAALDSPQPAPTVPSDPWRDAVLDAAAVHCVDGTEPREIVGRTIAAAVAIATDPAVAGNAPAVPSDAEIDQEIQLRLTPYSPRDAIALREIVRSLLSRCGSQAVERDAWVSVSERLPEIGESVLIHIPLSERGTVKEAWRAIPYEGAPGYYWRSGSGIVLPEHVTHWRPLPAPPAQPEAEHDR